jgi:uncharacterized protein
MQARMIHDGGGQRTFALVFDSGDSVTDGLLEFARRENLSAASFTAIGAFDRVVLGYFRLSTREYDRIPLDEQVEVLALTGNVARTAEGPKVHAHVVVGRSDGSAHGGHLLEARVRPTLEVVLVESPAHLCRTIDEATGLPLLDLNRSQPPPRGGSS